MADHRKADSSIGYITVFYLPCWTVYSVQTQSKNRSLWYQILT